MSRPSVKDDTLRKIIQKSIQVVHSLCLSLYHLHTELVNFDSIMISQVLNDKSFVAS